MRGHTLTEVYTDRSLRVTCDRLRVACSGDVPGSRVKYNPYEPAAGLGGEGTYGLRLHRLVVFEKDIPFSQNTPTQPCTKLVREYSDERTELKEL